MTDATYRIEIRPDPHSTTWPYAAHVTRISDSMLEAILPAESRGHAEQLGRAWVAAESTRPAGDTLYVGDDGQDAEVPL